ncbi:MAG: hypothetical protein GF330_02745, partial [Candidatus Eisenbacteria bacterium]|nr:hypothetical protein [Candidatus Eisenbacteria bacterium]
MSPARSDTGAGPRRGTLRTRLLFFFVLPVLACGAGMIVLIELLLIGAGGPLSATGLRALYIGVLLVGLILSTALALHVGERVTQPIAGLLRRMDAGHWRSAPHPRRGVSDWEMGVLEERVAVLLQQNRSGARAVEQLDALRDEIAAVLESATEGAFDPRAWPAERVTHPLTRELLDFFQAQGEQSSAAILSLRKLQGLLEQDWREETRCIEQIVRQTERSFVEQTQIAMELQKLQRHRGGGNADTA